MTTKTITIRYTKSDARCLFTCTAGASNVLAVGDFMAIVALDALRDADKLADKLEVSIKPGGKAPHASQILLDVRADDVGFEPDPQGNGAYKFTVVEDGVKKIAETSCGLLVKVTVGGDEYEFGVVLMAVLRDALFNPSGGLDMIKLPPPSSTISGHPWISGTIRQPVFPHIPEDRLSKELKVEGRLPHGLDKP